MRKARRRFVIASLVLVLFTGPAVAAVISGVVRDERGVPIQNVNLDFILVATGDSIDPVDPDFTDAAGVYSSTLPNGVYDVLYIAEAGSPLAGHMEKDVNLNVTQSIDVVLRDAWFVTGLVKNADTGLPMTGVDLDFEDLATGERIFTPRDNTDLTGIYNVAVPMGIYEVTFDAPEPALPSDPWYAHGRIEEISVDGSGGVDLPPVTLGVGFAADGEVFDGFGIPIAGADLDFFLAGTEQRIFTKNDNTDAGGSYETIVPAGTYDVEINPPQALPMASKVRQDVVIAADTFVGTDFLETGIGISGTVRDPDGRPIPAVDLDFVDSVTGMRYPTIGDDTNASGAYSVRVPAGTYNIRYQSQRDQHVEDVTDFGVAFGADTVRPDIVLPYRDEDADGVLDLLDVCPLTTDNQLDQDVDGVGNACDNCPGNANPRQEDNDGDRTGDACDDDDDNDGLPDAADADLDGDGIDNVVDNCPQASNHLQLDLDSDGVGNACDPDDGEVEQIDARDAGFVWRPETGASGYHVYRQKLSLLSTVNYGRCFHAAPEGTMVVDRDPVEPGDGFAYLVNARMGAFEGSLGSNSSGTERPNLRACP